MRHRATARPINIDLSRRPWLNTHDAAVYVRYTGKAPLRSVYRFMARHGIVPRRDGKRILTARAVLTARSRRAVADIGQL